jgi:hypothetical protein
MMTKSVSSEQWAVSSRGTSPTVREGSKDGGQWAVSSRGTSLTPGPPAEHLGWGWEVREGS